MRAQFNDNVSKLLGIFSNTTSLAQSYQAPSQFQFFMHILKSMFQFTFKIIPIGTDESISMGSTILAPPSQSIFFTSSYSQFHFVMVRSNVYKLTVLFYSKNPGLQFWRIAIEQGWKFQFNLFCCKYVSRRTSTSCCRYCSHLLGSYRVLYYSLCQLA